MFFKDFRPQKLYKEALQNTFYRRRGEGAIFRGGNFPRGTFPGGIFPGGIFPGGIFPSTNNVWSNYFYQYMQLHIP